MEKIPMKLIMENWRQYMTEEPTEAMLRREIMLYLEENDIVMTEEQINELVPKALKRAAMMAALGGAAGTGASAQAGVGPVKDKITMMKKGVKDKAGDVKQKMQDLGVKVADSGEDDASSDVPQEIGSVVDNGDGSYSLTLEGDASSNLSLTQNRLTSSALQKLKSKVGDGYDFSSSISGSPSGSIYVTVTATPAGS
tara:strand:+ start:4458 stop:5048 length:591 start_codon:yes stop_codon:yes gene_type:complete